MTEEELDEAILTRLRQQRESQEGRQSGSRLVRANDLVPGEDEERVAERLRHLAGDGLVKESEAAPGRWMIVLQSDS